jgi:hypothetical protein
MIRVPYEELRKAGYTLIAVAEDLGDAHGRIEHFRSWEVGAKVMDDALNHFADKWKYGMSILRDSVTEAGQALITVSDSWEATDRALADGMRPTPPDRCATPGGTVTHSRSGEPWRYPALGFDPLPGDPEVISALAVDAGIFGQRMVDCAAVLRRASTTDGWEASTPTAGPTASRSSPPPSSAPDSPRADGSA